MWSDLLVNPFILGTFQIKSDVLDLAGNLAKRHLDLVVPWPHTWGCVGSNNSDITNSTMQLCVELDFSSGVSLYTLYQVREFLYLRHVQV